MTPTFASPLVGKSLGRGSTEQFQVQVFLKASMTQVASVRQGQGPEAFQSFDGGYRSSTLAVLSLACSIMSAAVKGLLPWARNPALRFC